MLQEIIELQNSAVEKLVALTRENSKNSYTFRAPTGSGKTYDGGLYESPSAY